MRTDLAKESRTRFQDLPGIREERKELYGLEALTITVETEEAAKRLDKPMGIYSTLTFPQELLKNGDVLALSRAAAALLNILLPKEGHILVIGLGNRYITADSLGTKTAENMMVTRHLLEGFSDLLPRGIREVSSFCAGVLGVTGLETVEVVSALCEKIHPKAVLVVDSLAASDPVHLGSVLQMNDSGISPGAGIGNFQTSLNRQTLDVPVIAIGIPLVVDTMAVIRSVCPGNVPETVENGIRDLCMTPKDIDLIARNGARLLTESIHRALYGKNCSALKKLLQ